MIVQDDRFDTDSVTVCPFTTDPVEAPLFRVEVDPSNSNGLHAPCRLMVDKITSMPRSRLGNRIGVLDNGDVVRLNRAIVVFLGIAASR